MRRVAGLGHSCNWRALICLRELTLEVRVGTSGGSHKVITVEWTTVGHSGDFSKADCPDVELSGDDFISHGVPHQLAYRMEMEFPHDVSAVRFHGLDTDAEHVGDFLVALAFGEQLDDFPFARSERPAGGFTIFGFERSFRVNA